MDPFTGALLLALAIIASFRSGAKYARDDYRRTREAETKAASPKSKNGKVPTVAAGKKAKRKARRKHQAGWWASEISHGFPVTRTGLHTGWLSHKAAAVQTRAQREEARTQHLDVTASYASAVKDHRRRQQAALRDINAALAESDVEQDGSRKKIAEAVDEVAVKRAEKAKAYDPAAMDKAWDENWRPGDRSAPEPGPYAVRDDARPDDSSHLEPGQPRCEACGGTGGNPDGPGNGGVADSCGVCRGWGRAYHDTSALDEAPAGSVCTACGRPGTADDPVLIDCDGHHIHRSHLAELHERYVRDMNGCTECGDPLGLRANDGWAHEDCDRVSSAEADACEVRDNRDTDEVDAELLTKGLCSYQTGTDGGNTYCGRSVTDTGGDEPDLYCLEHGCTVSGDEAGADQERNERVAELLHRDAHDPTAHSSATEGETPMSGDTTFSGVKRSATAAIGQADQDVVTIRGRKDAAFRLADEMQSLEVDPAVVSEQMNHAEALRDAEEALIRAGEHATQTSTQLERYHAAMEEATVSAPGSIAAREFHGE